MSVLVDSNIIIDVITADSKWADWSIEQLELCESEGLVINAAVYAELSYGYDSQAEVDALIKDFGLVYKEIPRKALFSAAKAFEEYKSKGGVKHFVLPDFFIGGHAETSGMSILTRDVGRYKSYFASVSLLHP